jgi:FMN phosphatase YigB (HAD superfamily)
MGCGSVNAQHPSPEASASVFLFDVDNTLLDNDRVQEDLRARLALDFGAGGRDRYWSIFEELRAQLGFADYLGALQRFRFEVESRRDGDPCLLLMSTFLVDYPFVDRLYPHALEAIRHIGRSGLAVIVSDGDVVLQPRKIQRSGLWEAVAGRVLVYVHKEMMLDDMMRRYPARHYILVDDKLRILSAMKRLLGNRLTTVFVRQGHYALDPHELSAHPAADLSLDRIGELRHVQFPPLEAP